MCDPNQPGWLWIDPETAVGIAFHNVGEGRILFVSICWWYSIADAVCKTSMGMELWWDDFDFSTSTLVSTSSSLSKSSLFYSSMVFDMGFEIVDGLNELLEFWLCAWGGCIYLVLLSCLVFDYSALGLNFGLEFFFLGFAFFDFVEDYFENVSLTGVFMGLGSINR